MFLINRYSFTVLFLTCTGLSLCAFFFSWKMKGPETIKSNKNTSMNNNLFLERKIITPALTNFMHNFVWGAVIAFFPLYAIQCRVKNPGLFFSATAIMIIAGRILGGKITDACSKEKIVVIFLFISMVAMVVLAFSRTLPMFILVGLLWGTGGAFFFPASMAYAS